MTAKKFVNILNKKGKVK